MLKNIFGWNLENLDFLLKVKQQKEIIIILFHKQQFVNFGLS